MKRIGRREEWTGRWRRGARALALATAVTGGALAASGGIGDLAGAADGRLARYVRTAADYGAYEGWMQANGLGLDDVTNSPHAWSSYALGASGLINPQAGDVSIVSLEMVSNQTFTLEVDVKDVLIGPSATAANLATVFEVQGAPSLAGSPFSSDSVNATLGVSTNGRLQVVATPTAAHGTFFVRVRMHADDDGWPFGTRGKVQLWEGGPYWAETNIGADEPWESGYYFWWGDTVGYRRENDAWVASDGSSTNFSFCRENTPTYGKNPATLQSEGWITADNVLAPEHDAARTHWGGEWRMPTDQELADLYSMCIWATATTNGVNGYIVRGKNAYASARIFLPIAGYSFNWTSFEEYGSQSHYWSSVPQPDSDDYSRSLFFRSSPGSYGLYMYHRTSRFGGLPIRPVRGAAE